MSSSLCDNGLEEGERMMQKMDRYTIITLKKRGLSFRKIAAELGVDRKTVSKVWTKYCEAESMLLQSSAGVVELDDNLVETLVGEAKYDVSNRGKRKLNEEVKMRVAQIFEDEVLKKQQLGSTHKQKLTAKQIHEILNEEGLDIGLTTVTNYIRELKKSRDTFIRQDYQLGHRLEYDFGEVKLMIDGKRVRLYLAVFTAPASDYRHAYLYTKQNQEVFLDSHVRFFEELGGSWTEVVYDNMRNVVSKFQSGGVKVINEACINLALYYNFEVITTNVRSGHEKGSVENSVKVIRNRVFAKRYQFESLDEASIYLAEELKKINAQSLINEEKEHLQAYRLPYEIAEVELHNVDKYGCVRVENNYYSVPDYLLEHKVSVKKYYDRIVIYARNEFVCEHKKIDGSQNYQLVLSHYLNTLTQKPGALKHSLVLKQYPELYDIYHTYFRTRTKEFIAILQNHSKKELSEILEILKYRNENPQTLTNEQSDIIQDHAREQLKRITELMS